MTVLKTETKKIQEHLAMFCQSGRGAENFPEHTKQYRRLIFTIIWDTLKTAYPITHQILTENEWDVMVHDFFENHSCQSSQIWRMPEELLFYVENENYHSKLNRPYLCDLLYFEWLEIEVFSMPNQNSKECLNSAQQLQNLEQHLCLNLEYKLAVLDFPVHKAVANELAELEGNYSILIYREPITFNVRVLELNPLSYLVIEGLAKNPTLSARKIGEYALAKLNLEFTPTLEEAYKKLLLTFLEKHVLLGVI